MFLTDFDKIKMVILILKILWFKNYLYAKFCILRDFYIEFLFNLFRK